MKLMLSVALLCFSNFVLAATSVVVRPLQELLIPVQQSAPAQVVNDDQARISAQLAARVEEVLVRTGDTVNKDQPLIRLDCRDYKLAMARAESSVQSLRIQIRLARQQLNRTEQLLQQKSISRELLDQRRAEFDSLQAQLSGALAGAEEAQLAVSRCIISAPSAGVITERLIAAGSYVNPGIPLLHILDSSNNEVSALLSSAQIDSLKQTSELLYQFNGQHYPLTLRSLVPLVDNRTRTQQVRLSFSAETALAGSSGRLLWQEPAGRLPVRYIVSRNGQLGVMLYRDGIAHFTSLPEAIEGQAAAIDLPGADLPENSMIIIEGQYGLSSGDNVEPVE